MALIAGFVDTIASSPTVRLNTHDGSTWRLTNASRFDPPPAKRARVSTLMADGAIYPASAYEDRLLQLNWSVNAASTDAAATQIQLLARELDRPNNIFRYQLPDMTNPVFFKTQRLGLNELDILTDGRRLRVSADVLAEPFAYGLPQTLSQVQVNNDPAAGSNGMFLDISGVLGDVETPLVLKVNHGDTVETWGKQTVFAMRRRGTPSSTPFFLQCESMTQGTDTTTQPNDAVMSGSSNNFSRCTFTTATMTTRLSTTAHPSSPSVDVRGSYRAYLRYRKSVSADDIDVRLQWGESTQPITNSTVTLPAGTSRRYADLGDVQIPRGADAPTELSGATRSAQGTYLAVQAERVSGSGNLDLDLLLLIPADDRLCLVYWSAVGGPTWAWVDGVADATYATDSNGATASSPSILALGGLPSVSPGVTNRVFVVADVNPLAAQDSITDLLRITPSYVPRYLHVRPPST